VATTRAYRDGVLLAEGFPVEEISDRLRDRDTVVWVDLCTPTEDDLRLISEELGLDALAVEDAVSRHERPKVDHYEGYLFLNTYAAMLDRRTGRLALSEISAFVNRAALVTVRHDEQFAVELLRSRWDQTPDLLKYGTSALLYGLVDLVVDGYFEIVQALDDEIEGIEDLLFDERSQRQVQRRNFALRKSLVQLRRVVLPMREVVNALMRRDLTVVEPAMLPYYQDVYDHVLRATEWTESLRDMVTTIFETNLSLSDHQLNTVMKKLTAWAAIIAVPTAVTGFFGQNVLFPGYGRTSGLIASVLIIAAIALGLYAIFKRRDWI